MASIKGLFSTSSSGMSTPDRQSPGILDDFAVRKDVATLSGTIQKVPVNGSDIVNKTYADNISGAQAKYLLLSGANANQNINVGNYYLSGSGLIATTISGVTLKASSIMSVNKTSSGTAFEVNNSSTKTYEILNTGVILFYPAAATYDIFSSTVTGDAQPRIIWNADGLLEWGGGSGLIDTNLYRSAANILKTDDSFYVNELISGAAITVLGTISGAHLRGTSTLTISGSNFVVDADGKVGIGTNNPSGKFDIVGSAATWTFNTGGTEMSNNRNYEVKIYASNASGILSFGAGGRDNDFNILANGNTDVVFNLTAGTVKADNGFTGSGAYTNFTISGGIVLSAS